ncbi:MAG TPA: 3-dehydroquinate synthase [Rhodothermales bacterium]|nr:3-dehydroquinate synthase [Rhodothermales bacterium]
MEPIHQHVPLLFTYEVHFTTGLFEPSHPLLARIVQADAQGKPKKLLFAVDSGVLTHHPDLLDRIRAYADAHADVVELAGEPLVMPGGESSKNDPRLIERIHRAVNDERIDRHSYVVAVGGGAVLDAVGYAAATAHRGIRLIRVPTTVLSQNDSAVGVKNSVNAFGKKNFLGTFAPPFAVLNDFSFLTTLDDRDWRSGISEAVKVALIKDASFFSDLERDAAALVQRDMEAMQRLIYRCAELHLQHIATSGDPFELGSSRPLDFGHWSAHRLEQLTGYELRHGEAVATGIALDTAYSYLQGRLSDTEMERVLSVLEGVGFRLFVPEMLEHLGEPDHPRSLFRGLQEFREHLGGELTVMLLDGIGKGVEVNDVDLGRYTEAIMFLRDRSEVCAEV